MNELTPAERELWELRGTRTELYEIRYCKLRARLLGAPLTRRRIDRRGSGGRRSGDGRRIAGGSERNETETDKSASGAGAAKGALHWG